MLIFFTIICSSCWCWNLHGNKETLSNKKLQVRIKTKINLLKGVLICEKMVYHKIIIWREKHNEKVEYFFSYSCFSRIVNWL